MTQAGQKQLISFMHWQLQELADGRATGVVSDFQGACDEQQVLLTDILYAKKAKVPGTLGNHSCEQGNCRILQLEEWGELVKRTLKDGPLSRKECTTFTNLVSKQRKGNP